jgi:hypothetical protein
MDWFPGKSTGNHGFSHEIWGKILYFFPQTNPLIENTKPAIALKKAK